MASVTLTMDSADIERLAQYYQADQVKPVPHSVFRAQRPGVTITAYHSGKVLFQGNAIESEVARWQSEKNVAGSTKASTLHQSANLPDNFAEWTIIGSDEVGNGSYFGALTVCAVYLDVSLRRQIATLGVKDSKLLNDSQIIELAAKLQQLVPYHLTVCSPSDYNRANQTRNANQIKVSLHNFTVQKLIAKLDLTQRQALQGVLIDQFTSPRNYLRDVRQEAHPLTEGLYFAEKGESEHLAVACASIIARACFLESLVTFGAPYDVVLPSGAGANVDQFAAKLIQRHGLEALEQTAKLHFKNTEKAKRLAKITGK